jgi:hypothetical protein
MGKAGRGKRKAGRRFVWVAVIGVVALAGAFYFRNEIAAKLRPDMGPKRTSFSAPDNRAGENVRPRPHAAAITGRFTFFPDARNRYAWSVKYPDGRVFKLGEEFSSDCTPSLVVGKAPARIRFEFNEQRSCDSAARKPVQVDAEAMQDVSGSPEIIAAIITGGNVYGHTSSVISLSPKGPHVIRRVE